MSKKITESQIKKFKENFERINEKKYNSIILDMKRTITFHKTIKLKNTNKEKVIKDLFPIFIDSTIFVNKIFIFKKETIKIINFVPNSEIKILKILKNFIVYFEIKFKDNKLYYSNTIKSLEPFGKESIKGIINKKIFKEEFKKQIKIIKKTI